MGGTPASASANIPVFQVRFFRFPWAQGFGGFQAKWMNFNGEGVGEREGVICID